MTFQRAISKLLLMLATVCFIFPVAGLRAEEQATNACSVPFSSVTVAANNGNFSNTSITISKSSRRYYVSLGQTCSTNLKIRSRFCTTPSGCGSVPWSTSDPWTSPIWGVYRTNSSGIARVDFPETIGLGTYEAQLLPTGSSSSQWSNSFFVTIDNSASGQAINLADYIKYEPGYTYIGTTTNKTVTPNQTGETRLQIEEERDWGSGCTYSFRVRPWRITKTSTYAYWNPQYTSSSPYKADVSFRWMIVAPSFTSSVIPNFNNYYWGVGDNRYNWDASNNYRDIGTYSSSYIYAINGGNVPAYSLGRKGTFNAPFTEYGTNSYLYGRSLNGCPNPYVQQGQSANYHWRYRVEMDPPGSNVVRIDYYEQILTSPGGDDLLRESFYFKKDIGLERILVDRFNDQWWGPPCKDDSDCLSDTIVNPAFDVQINKSYLNPTFTVQVSRDNVTYSNTICAMPNSTYYLKLTNSDFTGYLEAQDIGGNPPVKWLWANNGLVTVNLGNVAIKDYTYKFRVWVPNQLFDLESNPVDASVPWSNFITVQVRSSC